MKIVVAGTGYLGAVHAASMSELGHETIGVDVDEKKISKLAKGEAPFVEPEFDPILKRHVEDGSLRFTTDYAETADAQVYFIGVGTPEDGNTGKADLQYVHAALNSILPYLNEGDLVVGKSTVPVGTARTLAPIVEEKGAVLVWNPEFLREGFAVQDTLHPDRMIYGLSDDPERAKHGQEVLDQVYAKILAAGTPRLLSNYETAELVKVSANSFLATKISFINAMSRITDTVGADVSILAQAIGLDERIGRRFLRAGIGFGGGCLPKDVRAFRARAGELGLGETFGFLDKVEEINLDQRTYAVNEFDKMVGGLEGKRVALLGASFKPDTDDLRKSPAVAILKLLQEHGADVVVCDPASGEIIAAQGVKTAPTPLEAIKDADGVFLATEWKDFKEIDPAEAKKVAKSAKIFDGRNALDPEAWKAAGWEYRGIGRR